MRLGFLSMNTLDELPPADLARALEERGYASLWVGEHSHIPVSTETPFVDGRPLPRQYREMLDPYLSLVLAAAVTSALQVGTGVALPLQRDLMTLAKTVASLDHLSAGRFVFGCGAGWNERELANHRQISWTERYRALAECIAALRALWSDEEAEFHGRYYDFDPVWSFPKPLQRPGPPVFCGMSGRVGVQHTLAFGDAWMPIDMMLGDVARKVTRFREMAQEAGRDELPITIVTTGNPTLETLLAYRDLGIAQVVLGSYRERWDDRTTTLPFLDHYAEAIPELA